jgi:hypothetical protein
MQVAACITAAKLCLTKEVAIFLPRLVEEEDVHAVAQQWPLMLVAKALKPLHTFNFREGLLSVSGTAKLSPIPLDSVQAAIHSRPDSEDVCKGTPTES